MMGELTRKNSPNLALELEYIIIQIVKIREHLILFFIIAEGRRSNDDK
jgi:hypothetical protein